MPRDTVAAFISVAERMVDITPGNGIRPLDFFKRERLGPCAEGPGLGVAGQFVEAIVALPQAWLLLTAATDPSACRSTAKSLRW
ncbi:hypothetical protein CMPELA_28830 [Cupriavidus necator]|nr:hypothetical protein C265_19929 [Cupriavidus sp. GA3-3]KUE90781.1 hypothetical protein ASL20_01220 [Cupriavidus necator]